MIGKDEILTRTNNGLDVFRHYLPVKWRVGRNFLNPLYDDHKASCNVYYDRRSGTYKMKDFGNGDYSGDCFFLVAKLKGLDCKNAADFVEVLETIDRELCLGIAGYGQTDMQDKRSLQIVRPETDSTREEPEKAEPSVENRRIAKFQAIEKPFSESERAYWGHRVSRKRRCTATGLSLFRNTVARRGTAGRSDSPLPQRNRCSVSRGFGA